MILNWWITVAWRFMFHYKMTVFETGTREASRTKMKWNAVVWAGLHLDEWKFQLKRCVLYNSTNISGSLVILSLWERSFDAEHLCYMKKQISDTKHTLSELINVLDNWSVELLNKYTIIHFLHNHGSHGKGRNWGLVSRVLWKEVRHQPRLGCV